MKKEEKVNLKYGLIGIKFSFYILLIILIILLLSSLRIYSFNELILIIFTFPKTSMDFLAVLGGIIIFLFIPFLIGVRVGFGKK